MKEIFCFIPAKSRSSRIKKKNSFVLGGHPLYSYPIRTAVDTGIFGDQEIVVSTDSKKIAKNSEALGGYVPYLRSDKLSRDPAGVFDVLIDFFQKFPSYKFYKYVCILLPTSPFTSVLDVKLSVNQIKDFDHTCLMSVSKTEHNSYLSIKIEKGIVKPLFPDKIMLKSTELDSTYHLNGAIHIIKISEMFKKMTYVIDPIYTYIMPFERSVDIDEIRDLELANFILNKR